MSRRTIALVAAVVLVLLAGCCLWLRTTYGGNAQEWAAPKGDVTWVSEQQDGPIAVRIGTSRDAGYRIGDTIAFHVVVVAKPGVVLDLPSLRNGVFSSDGDSPFELAGAVKVRTLHQHGNDVYVIEIDVRSWKVDPTIDFSVEIPYATREKDGTLDWSSVWSPTATIQTTRSAVKKDQIDEGNTNPVSGKPRTVAPALKFLGAWLLLCLLVMAACKFVPRKRAERTASVNKRAWQLFDRVFEDARTSGWTIRHYEDIAGRLRLVMGVQTVAIADLPEALSKHGTPDCYHEAALRVFAILEDALYAKRELSGIERAQLETDLEVLVPRAVA